MKIDGNKTYLSAIGGMLVVVGQALEQGTLFNFSGSFDLGGAL